MKHVRHAWEAPWAGHDRCWHHHTQPLYKVQPLAAASEKSGRPQHCWPRLLGRSEPQPSLAAAGRPLGTAGSSQELSVSLPTPLPPPVQAAGRVGCQVPDWPTREWTSSS